MARNATNNFKRQLTNAEKIFTTLLQQRYP